MTELSDTSIRNAAREKYAQGSSDNIEVDDDARIVRVDEGCWVQAWLWVPKEEPE